jgi:hypothetical protein
MAQKDKAAKAPKNLLVVATIETSDGRRFETGTPVTAEDFSQSDLRALKKAGALQDFEHVHITSGDSGGVIDEKEA